MQIDGVQVNRASVDEHWINDRILSKLK